MDYYANPPIMMVEFDKDIGALENDMPTSPLGSPPSTPLQQHSLFFSAERSTPTPTSSIHQSEMKRSSDSGPPEHLMQPADDEDIPMDERRHGAPRRFSSMGEDGPDDEKVSRKTMAAISPPSNMQIDPTRALNSSPARNRAQSMSPSQRLALKRSNKLGRINNAPDDSPNTTNGGRLSKNGSVKNMVSKYETSPMMKTPEKDDLLSPPKLLLKKSELWQDSPATGGRLPPSSMKRPTTRNKSSFQRSMGADDDYDVPHDERPSLAEKIEIPEDERMAEMSKSASVAARSASAAAKARFAKSSGRTSKQQLDLGIKTSLSSSSEPSVFAGELSRRLEAAHERDEVNELLPSSTPRNTVRRDVVANRSSPNRRPAPRRLDYDNGDGPEQHISLSKDDTSRSRAETLRRLRLSEAKQQPQQDEEEPAAIPKAPVPVYPPRVSASVAAALNKILLQVPMTDSLWDLKKHDLVPVRSLESFVGIAKGDLTICLLPQHEPSNSSSFDDKISMGAYRVQSIIRGRRRSRRHMGVLDVGNGSPTSPLRPLQPLDADDVIGMHHAALSHLLMDDIDRAIGCYREISSLYKAHKEQSKRTPPSPRNEAQTNFELAMSLVSHYLGILNLVKKKYFTAMTYFSNALETRMSCLVEGHSDQIACLSKISTCQYALDQFDDAQSTLRRAGENAKKKSSVSLNDRLLLAEMINNMGTVHWRKGMTTAANDCFVESLDILQNAASDCLYEDSATASQSVSLNIFIVRCNIGFAKMTGKEFKESIPELENALMGLNGLLKSGDEMSVATMDCLAAANLLSGKRDRATKMYERMLQILENEGDEGDSRIAKTMKNLESAKSVGRGTLVALETLEQSFAIMST
ncbi:unnamed protein product [Cylindrotheca closterium]|uniref:Uncharacterized protein n=1 Tax=Cylindrotheca closterium TaxID=2856 RepID=A0AAD2G6A6_9STRA|nr:unnamed protein product [Cylindrotheca closterium]